MARFRAVLGIIGLAVTALPGLTCSNCVKSLASDIEIEHTGHDFLSSLELRFAAGCGGIVPGIKGRQLVARCS
jgi:hypothetical protein